MLKIPLGRLSLSSYDRHAALRNYFCDKDACARKASDGWELELYWPDGEDRHVDPHLNEGLLWWGQNVTRSTMALAQRRCGRVLTSMYDTWTLHSWSERIEREGLTLSEPLTILHVDDHFDLGTPRLIIEEDCLLDLITTKRVHLDRAQSVREAILSGAIGMGSFLTPFVYYSPQVEIRHLRQPPKTGTTERFRICRVTEPDGLLSPGAPRPAVRLEQCYEGSLEQNLYTITPDLKSWLQGVGERPILLHVDMDYFNNRYDGDSEWPQRLERHDPPLDQILAEIDNVIDALRAHDAWSRIKDIVISYSPGFFPAEFWSAADARIRSGLEPFL